jgi:KaiC/GvpD/RAD55 family RecA-like ATPase
MVDSWLRPGWLCVLAGETSHGKTAAALEIAAKAVVAKKRVVLLSLEMDEELSLYDLHRTGCEYRPLYEQRMTEYDAGIVHEQTELSHWDNLHLDRVEAPGEIGLLFRRWKPDLLIVDHLQLLAGSGTLGNCQRLRSS